MDFDQILNRAIEMIQRRKRLSYRALKRQLDLDDAYLDDLKFEIIEVQQSAIDQDGDMIVWTGASTTPELPESPGADIEMRFQALIPAVIVQLQGQGRVTHRTLKYIFGIDDRLLADLIEELRLRRLAIDEEGKVLVWVGETSTRGQPAASITSQPNSATTAAMIAPASSDHQPQIVSTDTLNDAPPAAQEDAPAEPPLDEQITTHDPMRSAPNAERRQLTVMFCDLVGSTDLSGRLDPEDLREVVRAYQEAAATVIECYEGHIAQYLGDGLLIYFGYPVAHEDDAQRAVYTGLGIVEAMGALNARLKADYGVELAVRIGIHTGPVVIGEMGGGGRHENLALGETPNIAARLEGLAASNTVVVSSVTSRLLHRSFVLEELGPHELKGISEPMLISRVIGTVEPESIGPAMKGFGVLVGRDEEIGLLLRRWEQAKEGIGQVVLLSGEAGIGKSRLVDGLRNRVRQEEMTHLAFRCSPYHTNSALYPIIEHVQRVFNWQPEDTPDTQLAKLEQGLQGASLEPSEAVPILASLLSLTLPEGCYPTLTLSPQQQRQQTQDVLVAWLLEEAERQPLLAMWEDLHWADPSTLEFLSLVLEQTPTVPLLNVLTFRPEFESPWPMRSHMTPITLNRLERPQVEALVTALASGKALPIEVVEHVVTRTDGIPLFVEELTKMLLESELLHEQADAYELTGPLSTMAIPTTLQDSLMARLDRLSAAREIAQRGAVLGREFTYDMLQAVSPLDDEVLQSGLKQLVEAELLYQRGRPPRASYIFKHALVQDVAYASLLRSTQQQIHQQIAYALQARPAEATGAQPEILAHHFTEAGLAEEAVHYWYEAGQQASQRSASMEAIAHYRSGLELLDRQPQMPDHLQRELDLHIALGQEWVAAKGFAAPEVEAAYSRAQVLCQQVGTTSQLFLILSGLCVSYNVSGKLSKSRELAEQLLELAERDADLSSLLVAHEMLGHSLLYLGEFARALAHEEKAMALSLSPQTRPTSHRMGYDSSILCYCLAAVCRWCLGYPDQAVRQSQEALRLTEQIDHPFTHSIALYYTASIHRFRREWQATLDHTELLLTLATEHGYTHWRLRGLLLHGWALTEGGQVESGIAQMEQTLDEVRATGLGVRTWMRAYLAEAYGKVGQPEKGLAILREAPTLATEIEERRDEAELHRLAGDLLLSHALAHQAEAEDYLLKALRCAQSQQAKSLELRAAMSLSRLWQRQHKADQARSVLEGVYGWFTEGFDTADLQEAKSLLETGNL